MNWCLERLSNIMAKSKIEHKRKAEWSKHYHIGLYVVELIFL